MMNTLNEVEGNDLGKNIFIGKVVFNEDPLELRRVKVSIPNLLEGEPVTLPWIAPMFMGFIANVPGQSGMANLVPGIGAELTIEFQMGSLLHGLYVASPIRPSSKLSEFGGTDYLHKYGWKDPAGNVFIVNTAGGRNEIRILHASGTELKVQDSGRTTVLIEENLQMTVKGNVVASLQGNAAIGVDGNLSVAVNGNTNVKTDGDCNIDAEQGIVINANGNEVTVNNGDVLADGISLKNHKHDQVQQGGSLSGKPVPI